MGQIPPVTPSRQSPQPWQRSAHTPGRSEAPMNLVLTPGKTSFVLEAPRHSPGRRSRRPWRARHPPSRWCGTSSSTYSGSHWRSRVISRMSRTRPAFMKATCRAEDRSATSLRPPADADRHAFVAPDQQDILVGRDEFDDFGNGFAFGGDHCAALSFISSEPLRGSPGWLPHEFDGVGAQPADLGRELLGRPPQSAPPCRRTS